MTDPFERLRAALAGRYALERQVGQGGMATVYLARDSRHDRAVAIKVLRPELAASIGAERFLREIRLAARLQHPNILALYDSGEADGFLYYVMPYIEGESLRGRLTRERQLPIPDVVAITCEAADALGYAHDHGVVHRDIKPENILLLEGRALVADFGIARAVSDAGGDKLTDTGMAVGTPTYMSPEQALGGELVDGRSDIYSLGCVVYEMLIGQPPFDGPNAMAVLARHSLETVPSLQIVRHSIPDELEDAIMRALEKVPADRYAGVREFADALAEVDLGPAARRTTPRGMPARRTSGRGIPAVRHSTPRGVPVARERGTRFWLLVAAATLLIGGGLASWRYWLQPRGAVATSAAVGAGLDPRRIAVLYFRGAAGQDSLGFLADGLTESLIHELSQVQPLEVISRNGVSPYKNANVAPDSIARALKVGTLVDGTVAQSGDRLRVTVSLVNAVTGTELGSKRLERPREEIFALQDDLAEQVSVFLRERLGQEVALEASRAGTANPKAWEMLQRAEELSKPVDSLLAATDTAAAARHLASADSLLSQAESLDPQWTRPVVMRGWLAYHQLDVAGTFDKAYYTNWIQRGLDQSERALKLKPTDADALGLRGTLRYYRWILNLVPNQAEATRVLGEAEQDLRASVAADPSQAFIWTVLSHLLLGQSQTAEGKLAALRAYEADPYLTSAKQTVWRLFQSSHDLEDRAEAERWCAEGRRRFPDYYRFTECQIWLFALKDQKPDIPKAWRLLEDYKRLAPPTERALQDRTGQMLVAMALARAGLDDSARAVAVRSRGDARVDPTRELALLEALVRILLDDRDGALRMLSTYIAVNPQFRTSLERDDTWWFQSLREDPRFKALIASGR